MLELRDGTRKSDKQFTHSHKPAQNQQTSWLAQGFSTFGARKSHGRLQTHKIHHGPDSREATTFPHIVYSAPPRAPRGNGIQMVFCPGTPILLSPKLLRLGLSQLCGFITSCANLWLGWGLNRNCSPHRELSNNVFLATCTQGNWVDI
jgi:hypothetical protein